MTEWLTQLFENLQGNPAAVFAVTVLIGMIPVIELRGAIPVGVALGLDPMTAMVAGIIGNLLPIPFLILFTRKIFDFLARKSRFFGKIVRRIEERTAVKTDTVRRFRFFGLWIFVAIPLPGTGGVTGAIVAAMMKMKLKEALPPIYLGIGTAGLVVTGITYGLAKIGNLNDSVTWFLLAVAIVLLALCFVMAFGPLKKKTLVRLAFMGLWSAFYAAVALFAVQYTFVFFSGEIREILAQTAEGNVLIAVWFALIFGVLTQLMLAGIKKFVTEKGKKGKALIPVFVLAAIVAVCLSAAVTILFSSSNGITVVTLLTALSAAL